LIDFFFAKFHRFRHWISHNWRIGRRELLLNAGASILWIYILLSTSLSIIINGDGGKPNYPLLIALIAVAFLRALAVFRPRESTEEVAYREKRKVSTALVIDRIFKGINRNSGCTEEELNDIRREILICITEHVRQFQKDLSGVKIYANLLVEVDKDTLCVIARTSPRKKGKQYQKKSLKCSSVFESGEIVVCGNAKKYTVRNINYNSFVAYPITDLEGAILAVVTVDSTERHHFDGEFQALETTLRPYSIFQFLNASEINWPVFFMLRLNFAQILYRTTLCEPFAFRPKRQGRIVF